MPRKKAQVVSNRKSSIDIGNARIVFRNFTGKEGRFNPKGRRNFCVLLEPEIAQMLAEDGWNVKTLKPREAEDDEQPYIQVSVSYANYPPKVVMITARGKSFLDEDTINILDWADIENVDLIIRPYEWEVNGKRGTKAYVKSMYVTLVEDAFESKYRDVPDSGSSISNDDEPWEDD